MQRACRPSIIGSEANSPVISFREFQLRSHTRMKRIVFRPSLVALLTIQLASVVNTQTPTAGVRAYRSAHEAEIVAELVDLLSIPNVASDSVNIRLNAASTHTMMASPWTRPSGSPIPSSQLSAISQSRPAAESLRSQNRARSLIRRRGSMRDPLQTTSLQSLRCWRRWMR